MQGLILITLFFTVDISVACIRTMLFVQSPLKEI